MLRIGRVGRAHGTGGAFSVAQPTERRGLLEAGGKVWIAGKRFEVGVRSGSAERPVIKLEGIDDRTAARRLAGEAILVEAGAIGKLARGEFLVDDLIGLTVSDGERKIGEVSDVLLMPSADVLEVRSADGRVLLVPMIVDALRGIDLERQTVDVDLAFLGED